MSLAPPSMTDARRSLVNKHVKIGWLSLLAFLSLGVFLEILHGLKVGWYLDVSNETRRMMWTLAHTHGTLLGLIHLGFAASLAATPILQNGPTRLVSLALLSAGLLLPTGFFLGGLQFHGGDPGIGILLVPFGALLLLLAVGLIAFSTLGSPGVGVAQSAVQASSDVVASDHDKRSRGGVSRKARAT
ncbi:MAG: hypothetical protein ACPGXK_12645 [Phycisphaerae bacterium]